MEFSISLFSFNNHYGFAKWHYFCHMTNMNLLCCVCSYFQTKLSQNPSEYVLFTMWQTQNTFLNHTGVQKTVFIDAVKTIVLNNEYVTSVSKYFKSNPFHSTTAFTAGSTLQAVSHTERLFKTKLIRLQNEQFATGYKFKVPISSLGKQPPQHSTGFLCTNLLVTVRLPIMIWQGCRHTAGLLMENKIFIHFTIWLY